MYDRIQRYRNEDHRSVSWIAQKLHLNRRTVKRYLAMSQAEYERHLDASEERPLLLEPYTQFVVDRLNRFQDTKAAQMHDWLKESGDPLENAVAERANGILKVEWLYKMTIATRTECKSALEKIIDFYNTQRPHMSIGMQTPDEAHKQCGEQKRCWKKGCAMG